jgi:hypothetical protein
MQHSPEVMEGPGTQLFDHIAKCLADFVHENHLQEETSRSAQSEVMKDETFIRKNDLFFTVKSNKAKMSCSPETTVQILSNLPGSA